MMKNYKNFIWYFFVILIVIFGFNFSFYVNLYGLDYGWLYALNNIISHGEYIFGRDVFFTYGPFSTLLYPSLEKAALYKALFFKFLIIGSFLFSFFSLKKLKKSNIFIALLSVVFVLCKPDLFEFLAVLLGCICISRKQFRVPAFCLLNILAFLMLFVKFNIGITFIAVILCVLILSKLKKRILISSLIWLVGILSVTYFYFGSFEILINWFKVSLMIASGYTQAISTSGNVFNQIYLLFAGIIILTFFVLWKENYKKSKIFFIILPALFFTFKSGFVRADAHMMVFFTFILAVVPLLYLLVKNISVKKLVIMFLFALILPVQNIVTGNLIDSIYKSLMSNEIQIPDDYVLSEKFINTIKDAKVEVLPFDLLYLEKNHFNPHYNPLLQLYSVYTSDLDIISSKNYENKNTDYIIIAGDLTIDGRNLLMDNPKTWNSIRENYSVVLKENDKILLHKNKISKKYTYETLKKEIYKLNETINIPSDAKKAIINLDLSLTGKVFNFVFKTLILFVDVNYENNITHKVRFIPSTAKNGVYIYEFVENIDDLDNWLNNKPVGKKINSIKFYTKTPIFYKKNFTIEWQK